MRVARRYHMGGMGHDIRTGLIRHAFEGNWCACEMYLLTCRPRQGGYHFRLLQGKCMAQGIGVGRLLLWNVFFFAG